MRMKKLYKKPLFYLIVTLALGTLLHTFIGQQHQTEQLQPNMQRKIQNESTSTFDLHYFKNQVDQLTTSTWKELTANTGITRTRCLRFQNQNSRDYKTSISSSNKRKIRKHGTVSLKTKALIHEILSDFKINNSSIAIIPYVGHGSPAAADDYTIFIDERDLASFPQPAQRFVIAHEIAHMKNKDHSLESALENLVNNKDKMHRRMKQKIARSSESRADVDAMLKGPAYAEGGISFFETLLERYGDKKSSTHPCNSERLKIARDMYAIQHPDNPALLVA